MSYIYIISDGEYIKIGKANDVEKRIKELQTGNPKELKIIRTIECDEIFATRIECELHKILDKHKIRGEWYSITCINEIDKMSDEEILFLRFYENSKLDEIALGRFKNGSVR